MANKISDFLQNNIFSARSPENQNGNKISGSVAPSSSPTKDEADAAMRHLADRFAARFSAEVGSSGDGGDTAPTITDILRRMQNDPPFDEDSLAKKTFNIPLNLNKPPDDLLLADYDKATWRAIFNKAGYSILSDADIGEAVQALKNVGWMPEESGFGLNNLRAIDKLPGPMFIKTDQATIEKAKLAGQAVLQYQQIKAGQLTAAQQRGNDYVNEAIGGFIEKPYNAVVNNIDGITEPTRAFEKTVLGTNLVPELPRSTVGDRSEYWQQKRYGGVSLNMVGEGAATLQVGIMTGKPLFNTRVGALLGVQVGTYNIGVGASGTDPLHPDRWMSGTERGARIVGGTLGVISAPFSPRRSLRVENLYPTRPLRRLIR